MRGFVAQTFCEFVMAFARRLRFPSMNANRQLPFDVDDAEVQHACRAVARLLMHDAGEEEARRAMLVGYLCVLCMQIQDGSRAGESAANIRP